VKKEDEIIGEAIIFLLKNRPREKFSRKMLVEYLTGVYVYIYETSPDIEQIEAYLAALETVMLKRP